MPDIHQLPPLGLHLPAQRGYCDICRLEGVAAEKDREEEGELCP